MEDGRSKNGASRMVSKRKMSDEQFPTNLEGFGYFFNEKGQLRQIAKPDEGFVFEVKSGDKAYNQKHYEALGEVITEEVYKLLETKVGLKKVFIPVDATDQEPRGFFFISDGAFEKDRLMILIHGSGVVRAGQWARRLIINEGLDTGTQIPYILDALEKGYGVVVLNTNLNKAVRQDGEEMHIRGSEEPVSHALYVWDHFIRPSHARHIAIVAHSAGGYVTVKLADDRHDEFADRVFAVAFTDSVHSPRPTSPGWSHLLKVARNWVTSDLELGKPVKKRADDIHRVSAGHTSHEWTSPSAFADIKRFLQERYDALIPSTTSGDASKECSQDDMETENTANLASLESEISTPEKADVSNTDPISKVDDGGTPKATIEIGNGPDQKSDHDGNNGYVAEIGAQKTEL